MKSRVLAVSLTSAILVAGSGARVEGDSLVLDPVSPSLGLLPATPADILWDVPGVGGIPGAPPPPSVAVPFAAWGLVPGDMVDAISDGIDPVFLPHLDYFSVTRASVGAPGSAVAAETALDTPPTGPAPGTAPGQASDIFLAGGGVTSGTNILAPPTFGWTLGTSGGDEANANLITPSAPPAGGDNVTAYDLAMIVPGSTIFFSLAPGSPTLGLLGATPADVLVSVAGLPAIFVPAAALGLPPGADMDALAIAPGFGPGGIEYSLTTATAALLGLSGADILGVTGAGGVMVVHGFASLGLLPTDDVDAWDVDQRLVPEPAALGAMTLVLAVVRLCQRPQRARR